MFQIPKKRMKIASEILELLPHTTYGWNIKYQKCAGMGLNGFTLKKINENENMKIWKWKKNPASRLEVAC